MNMKLTRWLFYVLIFVVILGGILFYSWIFKYLISAVIFAYILNPWVCWLERHYIPRLLAILIVYILIGLSLTWGVLKVLPVLINQAHNLVDFITTSSLEGKVSLLEVPFIQNLQHKIDIINSKVPVLNLNVYFLNLINIINHNIVHIPELLVDNYQKILEAISLVATIPLIGFFLLKDNVKFRKDFLSIIPNRYFEIVIILIHKIDDIAGRYLRAMFYEIIIVGSLAAVLLKFLGVDYAILIGFMAGLANVIPYFGPVMGVIFAIISILISGSPSVLILYVIIGMYLIQVIDNNFVYPIVVGASIEMHPLIVLLTVLAGGWAWGFIGMLVSVPIVYLVYSMVKVLYVNLKEFKLI